MKLSEACKDKSLILRDGEFRSVGLLSGKTRGRLVYIDQKNKIELLDNDDNISCVITKKEWASEIPTGLGLVISENPVKTLFEIHNTIVKNSDFYGKPFENRISPHAKIHPTAIVAGRSVIVGKGCQIGPKAVIMQNSLIEENVSIGAGTIIGSDSLMFNIQGNDRIDIIPAGGVLIRKNVNIHANCCIEKAIFGGYTEIGEYTAFDNLVSIGANAKIGKRCLLPACVSIAPNVRVGDDVWIGPNAVISDGVTIGDGAYVTLGSVVIEDVPPNRKVTGNFAIDHERFIEFLKKIR